MAEPPQGALRYVASHAAQARPVVLLHRHFAIFADLRAAVGRLALLLELEGADALLPGLECREASLCLELETLRT